MDKIRIICAYCILRDSVVGWRPLNCQCLRTRTMFIQLNRQFSEWTGKDLSDFEQGYLYRSRGGRDSWSDILKRRRVVVLAEAGAGKSEEMRDQARLKAAAGEFAFYATLEDVDRDGLDGSLDATELARLNAWRASTEPAWFFLDSIDEAKLEKIRIERVLRQVERGITGAQRRAHIILSCRFTDWEPIEDLKRLNDGLKIPPDPNLPSPPTAQDELKRVLRHESAEPPAPPETALVVLMSELDEERIRRFATAKGIVNVENLLGRIKAANLWRFARRPLDLDWLVSHWQAKGSLGSLTEMIALSLEEHLREPAPRRSKIDPLKATQALQALERIGAALVFGRRSTIAIPDQAGRQINDDVPLDLDKILPDWSGEDRARLFTRPVFDPATYGRVRLHNDNRGEIRAYLTARWLLRLRSTGLSDRKLHDLLFSTTYGIDLVKPSMAEVAAWLSIWDASVGKETARRNPALLLTAGDPANLSRATREAVVTDIVNRLTAAAPRLPLLDHDNVRRFAQPDLGAIVRQAWAMGRGNNNARDFLLTLIELGQLSDCADLAEEIVYAPATDAYGPIFAGRSLMGAGSIAQKQRYVQHVLSNCHTLSPRIVLDAIDELFPTHFTVADLLRVFSVIDATDSSQGATAQWSAPQWIGRITNRTDLEQLLSGLLQQLGPAPAEIGHQPDKREETYFVAIEHAAKQLLTLCRLDEAPQDTIDAALRIGVAERFGRRGMRETQDIGEELRRTSARRRLAFWRTVDQVAGHPFLHGAAVQAPSQIAVLGYNPGLTVEDISWLIQDAQHRLAAADQRLITLTLLSLCRDYPVDEKIRSDVERFVGSDPGRQAIYTEWHNPSPLSHQHQKEEQQWERERKKHEAEQAERDRQWEEFIERMRQDPSQLRNLPAPTPAGVDNRLFHLWLLLSESIYSNNRYSISSVSPLVPLLGTELATALQDALVKFWRLWDPQRKSQRAAAARNQIRQLDCMGIAGISLEAAADPSWTQRLSSMEASRAAALGTLEINGFPEWFPDLAAAWPREVGTILWEEILAELANLAPGVHCEVLNDVARAGEKVARCVAPQLLHELVLRTDGFAENALIPILQILAAGLSDQTSLLALALERFNSASDINDGALYLRAAFHLDAEQGTNALFDRLALLDKNEQKRLVEEILPGLFGRWFGADGFPLPKLGFATLIQLIGLAFRSIRVEEDNQRQSGQVFSPNQRDNAENARNAAFQQLLSVPGRATFNALLSLADNPDCPIPAIRLREYAENRAAADSESAPWPVGEVVAFESDAEAAPTTPKDLQHVAIGRLEDMQHELLHGDFNQGRTLQMQPDETHVQNWLADRLRAQQGRAYSLEREPHVVAEKKPDIRLRAVASDASLAIEIKLAEDWSLAELESALTDQLCGQYLRDRNGRHGLLLLVHQKTRTKGWIDSQTNEILDFGKVVERLRSLAVAIAGESDESPQPVIIVLDVSSCAPPIPKEGKTNKTSRKAARAS